MKWSPRARAVFAAASGVLVGVMIVAATTLMWSGPTITLDSRTYAYETETLFGSLSNLSFQFRGVTFTFHLWCQILGDEGILCGKATELDGVSYSYSFTDGLPIIGGSPPWQTWVSPDGFEAVEYQQGGTARLLVEVL